MTATLQPVRDPDAELESRIKDTLADCQDANRHGNGKLAAEKWAEFVALIASRSPEQVAKLEKQKGLR
jgi:hypothetical protein